jgi:hypothetical protein
VQQVIDKINGGGRVSYYLEIPKFMLKSFLTASMVAIGAAIATLPVQALSLSTTFAGGNNNTGAMFDAVTFGNDLNVTGIEYNSRTFTGSAALNVYIKSGTYVGSETNSSAWTLVSQTAISSVNPTGTPTFVDVTDFILLANSTTGIYVTYDPSVSTGNFLNYTVGLNSYSNSDLQLNLGVGKGPNTLFAATSIARRTWNGTIIYDIVPVPFEFSPALGLGVLGGLFVAKKLSSKLLKK